MVSMIESSCPSSGLAPRVGCRLLRALPSEHPGTANRVSPCLQKKQGGAFRASNVASKNAQTTLSWSSRTIERACMHPYTHSDVDTWTNRFIESHVTSRWSTDTLGCRAGRRRARDRRAGRRRARDRRARLGCARDRRAASTRHSLNPAALSSSRFHKSPSHRTHEVALSTRAWWSAVAYDGAVDHERRLLP